MKPQQLAKLLNISPVTLRHWCLGEFGEFLSPSAQGAKGAKRSFSEHDARILAWVATLKGQNTPVGDIVTTLRSARTDNWRNLPPLPGGMANDEPIAVVPREAVEERFRAIQERYEAVVKERDGLKEQLEAAHREIEATRRANAEAIQALQQETATKVETLQQRITQLSAQEAELRGELKQYNFAGRRWNAMSLVIITLLVGVILTAIVLAAGILLAGK